MIGKPIEDMEAMPEATRQDRIKFAKEQIKKGVTAPKEIQQLVKKKFGTGLAFIDLGVVFPKKPGAKKKAAKKKAGKKKTGKRGRPKGSKNKPRKRGRPAGRRGRPAGEQWLLMVGNEGEAFRSSKKLQNRVADLLGEGYTQDDISIYEKTSMKMTVKTSITL